MSVSTNPKSSSSENHLGTWKKRLKPVCTECGPLRVTVTSRYVQRMLNLQYIGSCLNTGSQWIVKVNKASCIKMERLFTHCYRVLVTPNVYIHTCTHQMLGKTNHLWKMMFLHEFPFKNVKLHFFRGPSSSLFKLQGLKYFKKHPPDWTHSPNLREKGILLARFGKDIPWKCKSTIEIIGYLFSREFKSSKIVDCFRLIVDLTSRVYLSIAKKFPVIPSLWTPLC